MGVVALNLDNENKLDTFLMTSWYNNLSLLAPGAGSYGKLDRGSVQKEMFGCVYCSSEWWM